MASRYNIYYAGEVLDGQQAGQVREKLRALFNANDAALEKLFSGTEQVVKRECDKETALKYKQAMERAGARPVIRVVREAEAPAAPVDGTTTHCRTQAHRRRTYRGAGLSTRCHHRIRRSRRTRARDRRRDRLATGACWR